MFGEKAKLRKTIDFQNKRIEDLEFLLCQGEHDFVEIGRSTSYQYNGFNEDAFMTKKFKCRKCGKVISDTKFL